MMRALIVDDEAHCRENLSILLRRNCKQITEIETADSVATALNVFNTFTPHVIFLDIRMPQSDGFQLLKQIDTSSICVIFVTAHDEYALRSIKCTPIAYILKPIDTEELLEAVENARVQLQIKQHSSHVYGEALDQMVKNIELRKAPEKLCLSHAKMLQIVKLDEIIYLSSDSYYTTFYLLDNSKIVMSKTMKHYQDILGDQFVRIHRSHLINLQHVKEFIYESATVRLVNEEVLSVSRRKVNEVVQRLKQID